MDILITILGGLLSAVLWLFYIIFMVKALAVGLMVAAGIMIGRWIFA